MKIVVTGSFESSKAMFRQRESIPKTKKSLRKQALRMLNKLMQRKQ
jgi:hypothetical protein